jgi:hypothetical protein
MSKLSDLTDPSVRPADFMRARRPELFSDSVVDAEQGLSKEVFDYHLDSLTSRKEEMVFEHFCRRLAEKALCPNLAPQTGPTGGGDSKCDAETHPWPIQIALRWYEGVPCVRRESDGRSLSAQKRIGNPRHSRTRPRLRPQVVATS